MLIMDEDLGLKITSVADPDKSIHRVEYKGHSLRVLENRFGSLRIDKAWDSQGQEINPASLGELYLRKETRDLRPNCVNQWGYDHLGDSTADLTHYQR